MKDVRTILNIGKIPMLLGEPGIGKSSWVEDLAKETNTKCFTLACNQLYDKADLTGARLIPLMDKNGNPIFDPITNKQEFEQVFYPHSVINQAINYANENPREKPILFLDELNRTPADVTSALLSLATTRSIGNKKLPENLKIITAGNNKGNVTALDTASISRFVLRVVEPDIGTFLNLDPGLNIFIKNVLKDHPSILFEKSSPYAYNVEDTDDDDDNEESYTEETIDDILNDEEGMTQLTTPRTISALSDYLNAHTKDELQALLNTQAQGEGAKTLSTNTMLEEIIEGFVGNTNFKTYLLNEIIGNIATVESQSPLDLIEPDDYQSIRAITTRDDLNEYFDSLLDKEKSQYLLYMLYENSDNSTYIDMLAKKTKEFEKEHLAKLVQLATANKLTKSNVLALKESNSDITKGLEAIFQLIL